MQPFSLIDFDIDFKSHSVKSNIRYQMIGKIHIRFIWLYQNDQPIEKQITANIPSIKKPYSF